MINLFEVVHRFRKMGTSRLVILFFPVDLIDPITGTWDRKMVKETF